LRLVHSPKRRTRLALAAGLLALAVPVVALAASNPSSMSWLLAGQDATNSRVQPTEHKINANNAKHLAVKWVFTTHGDVSATPTVANGVVYFPDFGGYLNAVSADTGALLWQKRISDYDGVPGAVSRNSPAIVGNELILGDNFGVFQPSGAHVFAVDATSGDPIWTTQVDANPAAQVTANPVVVGNKVVVGVASNEEADTLIPGYPCCTFRGSVLTLDAATGAILWKTYMTPDNGGRPCAEPNPATGCGFSGAAVWDTPAVDTSTGTIYVGTGNNYTATDEANTCEEAAIASSTSSAACTPPDDLFDSAVALDLQTGQIKWAHKVEGWDAWNVACALLPLGATWCPSIASPDYDFGGAGPNLVTVTKGQGAKATTSTLVGLGQKSGVYWAFDAATGATVWSTLVGPGSSLGGIEWGTAYDGQRIYVPNANFYGIPFTLAGGGSALGGSWAALDPATGAFDWQVATPGDQTALGGASEANGVVYVGSMDPTGDDMFALDAATGTTLWSFNSGASVNSAPAIVDGTLYWGSGYAHLGIPPWTGNTKLYAFSINGN
jgi:polyvinyl alcohol dehydrogenase (cytochrome)